MKITTTILIILIAILLIGYLVINKKKVKKIIPADFPLTFGSKGNSVKLLQKGLIKKGYSLPKFGADGVWGSETQNAILQAGLNKIVSYASFQNFIKI